MVGVRFVHSLPEGFAIGTAFASDRAGLSTCILLAIALQNVSEGTAAAIPMQHAGFTPAHPGRRDHRAAAALVRVRRGCDARARGDRTRAAGVHAALVGV
jgi:hypothetical protein